MNVPKKVSIIAFIIFSIAIIFIFAYNIMNSNNYLLIGFSQPILKSTFIDSKNDIEIDLSDEKEIDSIIKELRISKWKPYFLCIKDEVKQNPNYIMYIDNHRNINFIFKDKKTSYCSITINQHTKYYKVPLDSYRIIENLFTNTNE